MIQVRCEQTQGENKGENTACNSDPQLEDERDCLTVPLGTLWKQLKKGIGNDDVHTL